ncbi:uncharacterized protein LOC143914324 [Arctopsyche grandis]|uniref:uncharacterized protein LOC143914324 n=1 Tax=Arctopsyche grandis TaxID=121162 RepID=UPI00406D74D9
MSNVIYKVCLEDYSDSFLFGFGHLLQMQRFVDINIKCEDKFIKVHKIVLAANSKYFQETLQDNFRELTLCFNYSSNVIMPLIEFMYYGKTSFMGQHTKEIISAAKFFNIKGLSDVYFDGLDDLPEFSPPLITDLKFDSFIEDPEVTDITKTPSLQENISENGILIRIPFKLDGWDTKTEHLRMLKNNNIITESNLSRLLPKKGRGRPRKKNISNIILHTADSKMYEEEKEFQEVFDFLKLYEENVQKFQDRALDSAINSICEPDNSPVCTIHMVDNYIEKSDQWVGEDLPTFQDESPENNSYNMIIKDAIDGESFVSQCQDVLQNSKNAPVLMESSDETYINEDIVYFMNDCNMLEYEVIDDQQQTDPLDDQVVEVETMVI